MKKLFLPLLAFGLFTFSLESCKDKCDDCASNETCVDGECVPNTISESEIVKSGKITSNETWTADNVYVLEGKVVVEGATLTIEPGTLIKGAEGTESQASALVIARGSRLLAEGTADKPIIFTSILDNIAKGEITGTNLNENDRGKWGGLIVLGYAPVSVKNGADEGQIEGIPANEAYGVYGGNDPADNSGIIKYVSIRHGGALIGEGNEINGLTLGGVGTGTEISHVEVVANLDDGIECFGGSVNIDNALVAYQGDDALDIDQSYSGTFDNAYVVYDNSGDEFLEIDGPENAVNPDGMFTVRNSTFDSKTNDGTVDLKSKAQGEVTNNKFVGLDKFKLSASFTDNCTTPKPDAYDNYVATPAKLTVTGNNTNAPLDVYTKSEDESVSPATTCDVPANYQTDVDAIFNAAGNGSSASGATQSTFENWTWTSVNSKF